MNILKIAAIAAPICLAAGMASAIQQVDTIDAPTGFFVPTDAQKYDSPYYRGFGEDWGWTHNPLATGFTSAELLISAFDVDAPAEVDEIWVKDDGVDTLLGTLEGNNNVWAFTTFTLGANLFNDIENGLEVFMKISVGPNQPGWLVTLAKSVITTDGATPPPPPPGVPLPASLPLLLAGFGGLAALRRRSK